MSSHSFLFCRIVSVMFASFLFFFNMNWICLEFFAQLFAFKTSSRLFSAPWWCCAMLYSGSFPLNMGVYRICFLDQWAFDYSADPYFRSGLCRFSLLCFINLLQYIIACLTFMSPFRLQIQDLFYFWETFKNYVLKYFCVLLFYSSSERPVCVCQEVSSLCLSNLRSARILFRSVQCSCLVFTSLRPSCLFGTLSSLCCSHVASCPWWLCFPLLSRVSNSSSWLMLTGVFALMTTNFRLCPVVLWGLCNHPILPLTLRLLHLFFFLLKPSTPIPSSPLPTLNPPAKGSLYAHNHHLLEIRDKHAAFHLCQPSACTLIPSPLLKGCTTAPSLFPIFCYLS